MATTELVTAHALNQAISSGSSLKAAELLTAFPARAVARLVPWDQLLDLVAQLVPGLPTARDALFGGFDAALLQRSTRLSAAETRLDSALWGLTLGLLGEESMDDELVYRGAELKAAISLCEEVALPELIALQQRGAVSAEQVSLFGDRLPRISAVVSALERAIEALQARAQPHR
jgi:hypothetical protein